MILFDIYKLIDKFIPGIRMNIFPAVLKMYFLIMFFESGSNAGS